MNYEITISGFGGQGVLFIGRLLAEAALSAGKEVSWLPYYGAEKRGGMCSCYVNISDEKIGSIFITHPYAAIAMSPAAMDKLEPSVKSGGVLIVNQSLIKTKSERMDISVIYVPTMESAMALGDESVGNLVALGAMIAHVPAVTTSSIMAVINQLLSKDQRQTELNKAALMRGCEFS